MSDDDLEDEGEEEEEKSTPGGKKKLIIIIAVSVLVVIGAAAGSFFMGVFDSLIGGGTHVEEVVEIPPGPPVYHELPQIVVDLKKTGSRVNYIKLKVVAEIVTRDLPLLEGASLKINDKIQSYLRSQTREELAGSAGTEKMRADIEKIISDVMAPVKIEGVLFREILLQ